MKRRFSWGRDYAATIRAGNLSAAEFVVNLNRLAARRTRKLYGHEPYPSCIRRRNVIVYVDRADRRLAKTLITPIEVP